MVKIKDIKDFINLPDKAKILYFYLSESTDECDLVERPEQIVIAIGANEEDLKDLIEKRFLITCENGVIVIKNYKLRNALTGEEIKPYIIKADTPKANISTCQKIDTGRIIEAWNKLQGVGIAPVRDIKPSSKRYQLIKGRIREYGIESVLEAISNIQESDFLQGDNNNGWMITFDWFIRPNNFAKVLEGNYNKKEKQHGGKEKSAEPLIPLEEWNGGESDTPFI